MRIGFKKLTDTAKIPTYANETDMGCDFYADESVVIKPKDSFLVSTGIAWEVLGGIPDGYKAELAIRSKSGLSVKHKIEKGAGTVDETYRGEIKIHLFNFGSKQFKVEKGMKIAQGVIDIKPMVKIIEIDTLSETARGSGGFGSTGT